MTDLTPTIVRTNQRLRYTPEEDALILQRIRETPNNIKYACDIAARELGRDGDAVNARYYGHLRKVPANNVHTLSSTEGHIVNIKNTPRPKDADTSSTFEHILENMSSLTDRQKRIIISLLR